MRALVELVSDHGEPLMPNGIAASLVADGVLVA
jgi:hypothetical protein